MAIVFVGNSGAARECYWILRVIQENDKKAPQFKGFLSWQNYPGNLCGLSGYSLGDFEDYQLKEDDQFVIALGSPALRMAVFQKLKNMKASFYTLKYPNVYVCPSANIGEANIFTRDCAILADASVGDANYFNGGVCLGHDGVIGNANTINRGTSFSGKVRVGNINLFSPGTLVLQNAKIGSANVFAPYCVVYRGCGDYCLMSGNPALIEKRLEPHDG